jgi:chromosome partitioning protein
MCESHGMKTVALAALKGSQAKSTSTVHLAIALAKAGARVLVIDTDHQGAATNLLTDLAPPNRGALDVLLHGAPIKEVLTHTAWGVDLVGANKDLARADLALASRIGRETMLRTAVKTAVLPWDFCLIDTPPSIGLMTANALVAADAVLTPVVPAFLSLLALGQLDEAVGMVKAINPSLQTLGYLLCIVDGRDRITDEAREALRGHAGKALWRQEVRVDVKLKARLDAQAFRGRGAEDYTAVATELKKRLLKLPSELPLQQVAQ